LNLSRSNLRFTLYALRFTLFQGLWYNTLRPQPKERGALAALPPVAQKLAQSQRKLESYRATLHSAYGDRLHLRAFSVVAIGFERLVWQELDQTELTG
jgi:hypothetical protein